MRLYFSSTLMWGTPFQQIIKKAGDLDMEGIEVWAEQFWFQGENVQEVLQWKNQHNIAFTLHAPNWDLNLASLNHGIREASYQEICRSIELAEQLDARNITIHPGNQTIAGTVDALHREVTQEQLKRLNKKARQHGCVLSVEHMEEKPKELFCTPEEMNTLMESMPEDMNITLDAAHVPPHEKAEDYFRKMDRINKIHLSDTSERGYHVELGEGYLPLSSFLIELAHSELPIVLEGLEEKEFPQQLLCHLDYLKKEQDKHMV